MKKVTITVLNDDRKCSDKFTCVHGLSLLIEADKKILFDVGQQDHFLKNAQILGKDISDADYVVLSHGHYDHTDGLMFLEYPLTVVCHPDCTIYRISKRMGIYNGIPFSKTELCERYNMYFCKRPQKLSEKITFLGEIERNFYFECQNFPSTLSDGSDDTAPDDSGIVIDTERGLIIITGCGHSGICNTIAYAQKVTGKEKVLAVMGGFHLKTVDECTKRTLEFFCKIKPEQIYLGHCTSDEVIEYFKQNICSETTVDVIETGKIFEINAE